MGPAKGGAGGGTYWVMRSDGLSILSDAICASMSAIVASVRHTRSIVCDATHSAAETHCRRAVADTTDAGAARPVHAHTTLERTMQCPCKYRVGRMPEDDAAAAVVQQGAALPGGV